jgi:hypothetical protein
LDDRIIFTPPAADIPTFEKISDRETPVFFPYPSWNIDTIIVSIPAGTAVKSIPAIELCSEMGTYSVNCSVDRNNLVYIRDIRIKQGKFGPDQYAMLFKWTSAIHTFERQTKIIFKPIHE